MEDITTERLVELIQAGRDDLYLELWLRVRGFIWTMAKRRYNTLHASGFDNGGGGVDAEDLFQTGYIALVAAAATFDSSRGYKFLTWLHYYLRKEFRAAQGIRTKRRDMLDKCISLDRPLGEDEDETITDTIPSGRDDLAGVTEKVYTEQLHNAIEAALDRIPEREADAIRRSFYDGQTYKEIGQAAGVSTEMIRQRIKRGIDTLRKQRAKNRLEEFLRDKFDYYHGVGARQYNETRQSSTERLALKRINEEEILKKYRSKNL